MEGAVGLGYLLAGGIVEAQACTEVGAKGCKRRLGAPEKVGVEIAARGDGGRGRSGDQVDGAAKGGEGGGKRAAGGAGVRRAAW